MTEEQQTIAQMQAELERLRAELEPQRKAERDAAADKHGMAHLIGLLADDVTAADIEQVIAQQKAQATPATQEYGGITAEQRTALFEAQKKAQATGRPEDRVAYATLKRQMGEK